MERIAVYGVIVVLVVIGLIALLVLGQSGNQNSQFTTSTAPQGGNTTPQANVSGPLFSSEPYYGYSYLIYPGNISSQSRSALDGYNMALSQGPNGAENITLSTQGRGGTVTLQAGERLYIVETSFGDDASGYEGSVGDDGFVMVDQNGYVVGTFGI